MRNQNAYFTGKSELQHRQQCWNAFCQSGSVTDYIRYRECLPRSEEMTDGNPSDRPRTGHPGNPAS